MRSSTCTHQCHKNIDIALQRNINPCSSTSAVSEHAACKSNVRRVIVHARGAILTPWALQRTRNSGTLRSQMRCSAWCPRV